MTENKLKVLHITFWYPSRENPSTGIFVREHILAISRNVESRVIAFGYLEGRSKKLYEYEEFEDEGIPVHYIKFRKNRSFKINYFFFFLSTFWVLLKLFTKKYRPQIIHSHIHIATTAAALIGTIFRVPVVATEHFSRISLKKLNRLERKLTVWAFNHCKVVCPVSERLKNDLIDLGVKSPIVVIPNAVNTRIFYPPKEKKSDTDSIKVLFVGNLIKEKGLYELFEALAKLKVEVKFYLEILGDGPERKNLENLARQLNLDEQVIFHGRVPKEAVAEKMREASFLVHPSHFETFGCVVAEALCCGTPVLATNVGAIPEIIESDKLGILVEPKNIDSLYEGLKLIISKLPEFDPEYISELASSRYSYTAVSQKYLTAYEKAISEVRNKPSK